MNLARIAQMESSYFVGRSAETQALLRAPNSMTGANHFGHVRHLLPALHLDSEVAGAPADRNQMSRGDHYLDLRHNDSIECSTIDDARDPISKIAADHGIYDESLQTGNVRQTRRLGIEQIHMSSPLQGEPYSNTSIGIPKVTAKNKFDDRHLCRAAPCAKTIQVRSVDLRDQHFSFADGSHPLSGTDAIAIPPGAVVASDNFARAA